MRLSSTCRHLGVLEQESIGILLVIRNEGMTRINHPTGGFLHSLLVHSVSPTDFTDRKRRGILMSWSCIHAPHRRPGAVAGLGSQIPQGPSMTQGKGRVPQRWIYRFRLVKEADSNWSPLGFPPGIPLIAGRRGAKSSSRVAIRRSLAGSPHRPDWENIGVGVWLRFVVKDRSVHSAQGRLSEDWATRRCPDSKGQTCFAFRTPLRRAVVDRARLPHWAMDSLLESACPKKS